MSGQDSQSVIPIAATARLQRQVGNRQPIFSPHKTQMPLKTQVGPGNLSRSCQLTAYVVTFHGFHPQTGGFYSYRKNRLRKQAKNKHVSLSNLIMENVNIYFKVQIKRRSQRVWVIQLPTIQHLLQCMEHSKCSKVCDE